MNKEQKQLIYTLVHYGARSAKLSSKQERKLDEWILAYLMDDLGLSGHSPMTIKEMRKYIDKWEHSDLNAKDYNHYYVDKESNGNSIWDFF